MKTKLETLGALPPVVPMRTENDSYCLPEEAEKVCDRLLRGSTELLNLVASLSEEEHVVCRQFYREHLLEVFLHSPLLKRTYEKPLGYTGDFEMMNMIYRQEPEGDSLFAQAVDKYAKNEPAAIAVFNRIEYISERLKGCIERSEQPRLRIADIGCGPARDVIALLARVPSALERLDLILIDQDKLALGDAKARLEPWIRLGARIEFVEAPVESLFDAATLGRIIGRCNFIYSTGLFDYFNDQSFTRLLRALYGALEVGGTMFIGNISASNPTRWFLEYATDWFVFHRTPLAMRRLADHLSPPPSGAALEAEPLGINLFLVIRK